MSSGLYHFVGDTYSDYTNPTNAHNSGNFTDPVGAVTGCTGQNYPSQSINARELDDMTQKGGQGYGMSLEQPIPGFNRMPDHSSYEEVGLNSNENLGVSKQYNPSMPLPTIKGGGRKKRGGTSLMYYGFDDKNNENLSTFAGAGYPPITVGSQNLKGGRRLKCKSHKRHHKVGGKHRKQTRRKKHKKSKVLMKRRHKTKKSKLGLRHKMTSKLFKKIIGGGRQKGGYSQFMGDQAFSQGYELGGPVTPQTSSLANPIPFKPYNNCSDPFGPK